MKEKWIVRKGRATPIVEKYHMDPYFARIIASRIGDGNVEAFLDREGDLFDPYLLKDMDKAVELIHEHINLNGSITIVGDYDVDGMTSTAILYLGLTHLYPDAQIEHRIPERIAEGYGFSVKIAKELLSQGAEFILTCDNGIREFESAEFLNKNNVTMVITDHHAIETDPVSQQQHIPTADAVINPHQTGDFAPQKLICGAFVALSLIRALYIKNKVDEGSDPLIGTLIGYAALGTICDVMPLFEENRKLVYKGLRLLNRKAPCGIKAMMDAAKISALTPYSVGFTIGPMINAGGRLSSQNKFIDILISQDPELCKSLAKELLELNHTRQEMEKKGIKDGMDALSSMTDDLVKVIYLPDLHESIAGLVAGRVREQTSHPVFVATKGETGIKGSGRSIEGYPMSQEMDKVASIFSRHGGHAMAAGFSIDCPKGEEEKSAETMRKALNEITTLTEEECIPTVMIDATADPAALTLSRIELLEALEPFGTGNPRPLLAFKGAELLSVQLYGKRSNVARLRMKTPSGEFEAITFSIEYLQQFLTELSVCPVPTPEKPTVILPPGVKIDLVFEPGINEYYQRRTPQITVRNLRKSQ